MLNVTEYKSAYYSIHSFGLEFDRLETKKVITAEMHLKNLKSFIHTGMAKGHLSLLSIKLTNPDSKCLTVSPGNIMEKCWFHCIIFNADIVLFSMLC